MATCLVTGTRPYREHQPGSTFVVNLDDEVEARAIERGVARGSVAIVNRRRVKLDRSKATPPREQPE